MDNNFDDIKNIISKIIDCELINIEGDGQHFFVQIVSKEFEGLSRLDRHRLIKEALQDKFASNELHALSIQSTFTPEEWKAKLK